MAPSPAGPPSTLFATLRPGAARAVLAALACALASCGDGAAPRAGAAKAVSFGDVVAVRDTLVLEETDEVVNVAPVVSLDPRGGFLVADLREAQARAYRADGSLSFSLGRRGDGPGEMRTPVGAVRLAGGQIVTAALSGKYAVWSPDGRAVTRTGRLPVNPLSDLDVLDDTL